MISIMRVSLLILALLCAPVVAQIERSDNAELCKIPGAGLWPPPTNATGPAEVTTEFFLIDLIGVDDKAKTFTIDFVMSLVWQDDRLAGVPDSEAGCLARLDSIWPPSYILLNAGESYNDRIGNAEVQRNGRVIYSRRYTRVFSADLQLRRFPFDKQVLDVKIASLLYGPDAVLFKADTARTSVFDGATTPGWRLTSISASSKETSIETGSSSHSSLVYSIKVERSSGYYFWRLVFPLLLLSLMAWSVFWLSPSHLGIQVAVATGSIFSLMSFLVIQGQILPSVSYMTIADTLIVACVLLIFIAFGESIVTGILATSERLELAERIDRKGRWVYLVALVVVFGTVTVLSLP